ncbi:serine hydroxymethyltransferase [Verminephrobacter aporrectodeae]|uniref:serine hydroxymethyltransferase n=1 Tax=Verminephrobacter aporrectodeae TaxID=1110389 RepID=UPI00224399D1|nr:serine hydroxymethyltransferase [Verminephrobacter aporrectodeae]MCW8177661.1 serine hydroxymethyltransferase [Verminephrobacter aporrectodeae subsp. tuberculatae]
MHTLSLLHPGETLLGMDLDAGGHLSHGSKVNISGRHFNSIPYGVDNDGLIDFDAVERLALQHRPRLIIAGTTAYPRTIDFARFRTIADKVGAFMLADITHIAGLVAAGEHPSPIDIAHVTTLCTHKQLYGPRGGLILSGKEHCKVVEDSTGATLEQKLDRGVFPLYQGAPAPNKIAAKARALGTAGGYEFKETARRIRALATCAADELKQLGVKVQFGGTDNHIVIIDVLSTFGLTGIVAQKALEECGIIVNKNRIVGDSKPVTVASGVRLGTNSAAIRKITREGMRDVCTAIVMVLKSVTPRSDKEYSLDASIRETVNESVRNLCARFPIPGFEAAGEKTSLVHTH